MANHDHSTGHQRRFLILGIASIALTVYMINEERTNDTTSSRYRRSLRSINYPQNTTQVLSATKDPGLRHNITVKFVGRLGNLMFIYSSLLGIAKTNKLRPVIPACSELLVYFNLEAQTSVQRPDINRTKTFKENYSCRYDRRALQIGPDNDIVLDGYFQSWKYFHFAEQGVLRNFQFIDPIKSEAETIFDAITRTKLRYLYPNISDAFTFIAVHIRRGDLVTDGESIKYGFVAANKRYIENSFRFMMGRYPNTLFVVASDSMPWARRATAEFENVVFVPDHDIPAVDLAILALCNHTIFTVGSFGWWAAYLAGGDGVYYGGFPKHHSPLDGVFDKSTYYLRRWISLT